MSRRESRRATELKALRAELERRLDRLDFRFHNIGPALAAMAQRDLRRVEDDGALERAGVQDGLGHRDQCSYLLMPRLWSAGRARRVRPALRSVPAPGHR